MSNPRCQRGNATWQDHRFKGLGGCVQCGWAGAAMTRREAYAHIKRIYGTDIESKDVCTSDLVAAAEKLLLDKSGELP